MDDLSSLFQAPPETLLSLAHTDKRLAALSTADEAVLSKVHTVDASECRLAEFLRPPDHDDVARLCAEFVRRHLESCAFRPSESTRRRAQRFARALIVEAVPDDRLRQALFDAFSAELANLQSVCQAQEEYFCCVDFLIRDLHHALRLSEDYSAVSANTDLELVLADPYDKKDWHEKVSRLDRAAAVQNATSLNKAVKKGLRFVWEAIKASEVIAFCSAKNLADYERRLQRSIESIMQAL